MRHKIPLQAICNLIDYLKRDELEHWDEMHDADEDTRSHIFNSVMAVQAWLDTFPEITPASTFEERAAGYCLGSIGKIVTGFPNG